MIGSLTRAQAAPDFLSVARELLEWPDGLLAGAPGGAELPDSSSGPTIFAVVEEQLGLRLRRTPGPVDVIVINGVERPSPN